MSESLTLVRQSEGIVEIQSEPFLFCYGGLISQVVDSYSFVRRLVGEYEKVSDSQFPLVYSKIFLFGKELFYPTPKPMQIFHEGRELYCYAKFSGFGLDIPREPKTRIMTSHLRKLLSHENQAKMSVNSFHLARLVE